ncbi:MAG: hypothetical protein ACTSRZ_07275 [Promethearchaeota archaeon]
MIQKKEKEFKDEYIIRVEEDPEIIFKNFHYGINLPVKEEFKEYIMPEIKHLQAKAIYIMTSEEKIIGHSLVYKDEDVMFFGLFKAQNDSDDIIKLMISKINDIAQKENCTKIRGPINVPPHIYGWGFSEEGSDPSIAAATPFTNPKYIKLFIEKGFELWHRLLWIRTPIKKIPYKKIWDIRNPDLDQTDWILPFLEIQAKNFPESARLTPKRSIEVIIPGLKFIKKYGGKEFIYLVYHEGKMIGTGYATPNPFDLNEQGKCKSVLLYGGAVVPEFQRKGIMMQIFGEFFENCVKRNIFLGECVVGDDNLASKTLLEKQLGGKVTRSYQILQKNLK